jgi:sulfur-oxidizing protein SoxY
MGMKLTIIVLVLAAMSSAQAQAPADDETERAARWKLLQQAVFKDRPVEDGSSFISIDAPVRALDAALVPVALLIGGSRPIRGMYLIIDSNPAPLAGHFTFGPKADPHGIKLRVRVDAYTYLHAVAETADGHLYSAARFIKASGGCSAPAGSDEQQALQDIGHIKVKLLDPFVAGQRMQAQLMIRHPNFNGMQMNQVTRMYTPARFIRSIDVNYGAASVLHVDSDISMSTDPVITFGFVPPAAGELSVSVRDTQDKVFEGRFAVPAPKG